MSESVYLNLSVSLETLGEALSDLTPEQVVEALKIADEHSQDWDLSLTVFKWADERQRAWDLEQVQEESDKIGKCVRSDMYPGENWVHSSPHKGCVLR